MDCVQECDCVQVCIDPGKCIIVLSCMFGSSAAAPSDVSLCCEVGFASLLLGGFGYYLSPLNIATQH